MNLNEITTLKAQVDQCRPISPELMEVVEQKFKIEWTYHSNAIEGNTLSLQETTFFLEEGLTSAGKTLREYLEAQNHAEAVDFLRDVIHQKRPISESLIKELHALLLKGINEIWVGPRDKRVKKRIHPCQYKTEPNHVLTLDGNIHYYCDPLKVPEEMEKLIHFIQDHSTSLHPVELAARAHYQLVAIHPFDDGNGRIARLLMNLILLKEGYPPVVIRNERREEYYQLLMKADQGEISPFVQFIAQETKNSLSLLLNIVRPEGGTK